MISKRIIVVIFLAGLCLVTSASVIVSGQYIESISRAKFDLAFNKFTDQLISSAHQNEIVLNSSAGFFESSSEVSQKEWKSFISTVNFQSKFAGVLGINVPVVVRDKSNEAWVIQYVYPENENKSAINYDVKQNEVARAAYQLASEVNTVVISDLTTFIQDPSQKPGVLIIRAINKNNKLYGFVGMPLFIGDFIANEVTSSDVDFPVKITQIDSQTQNEIELYSSSSQLGDTANAALHTKSIQIFNTNWSVEAVRAPNFGLSEVEKNLPLVVGIGVGSLGSLLGAFVLFLLVRDMISGKVVSVLKASLSQSESLYQSIFNNLQDVYYRTDLDGKVTVVSPSIINYIGIPAEKIIGTNVLEFYSDPEQRRHLMSTLLKQGFVTDFEVNLKGKDAEVLSVSVNAHVILNEHNKPVAVEGVLRDISNRKKEESMLDERVVEVENKNQELAETKLAMINLLEDVQGEKANSEKIAQDLQKFQLAVESTTEHVVITDPEGIILYANPAVAKITGFSQEEVIGKKAGSKDLWGGQMTKEEYEKFWKKIKINKETFRGEFKNRKKNGQQYVADVTVSPVIDAEGNLNFYVAVERDVTKEKEVDRMKTEFISLASHQLKTPLSAMRWFSEMLLNGDVGKVTAEQKEIIENIHLSNKRMIELVNSLLNISRIESGRIIIDPKPTSLKELIDEVTSELQERLRLKKHTLKVVIDKSVPKTISIDPKLIREVYKNLLTNAIKYTLPKGNISVTVSKKGDEVISAVADSGLGVPKMEQKKIFDKFYRGTNIIQYETDGTGLGLYLVKSIIDSSQGRIWFESEENKGTTFFFSLPLSGVKPKQGVVEINS